MARREQDAQRWVDHTLEVRHKLNLITAELLDAESSTRAFVITGQPDLLPWLQSAQASVIRRIRQLQELVKDNPEQLERIPTLRALVDKKFEAMGDLTSIARTAGTAGTDPELKGAREAMRPLRVLLDRMDDEEVGLQAIRQQQLQRARSFSLSAGIGTLVLGLLGGIGGALLFGRSIAWRMQRLCRNARALRLESQLVLSPPALDEIGEMERELAITSALIAEREEKLRQSEAQLRAIIDNTTALVYIKDLEGRFQLVNRHMEHVFQMPASRFLGRKSDEVFAREFADKLMLNDQVVLSCGEPREFEEQILHRGELRTFLASKVPLLDANGKPYALCGISTDISERARAAEILRQAHDQLEERVSERTAELQTSNLRLQEESEHHRQTAATLKSTQAQLLQAQKMEIIGNVASGIAHDFNNILTAIMGYASLLLGERGVPAPGSGYAAEIMRAAERASTLSKQLLGFGRVQPSEQKVIALPDIIRGSESMLRRVLGDTISLRTMIERNVRTVRANPSQIEQLLLNLVVNARDAMPTGGRITIGLRHRADSSIAPNDGEKTADWVELSVSDEGTGIPPEVQRHMFEPFFTTKRPGQGTGLGLATCAMIAQQNHGRLDFTTMPAKGTTFRLLLPALGEPVSARPVVEPEVAPAGSETLLVVEDEPAVGEIMALLLRDLGYHVITAENGEAAERAIALCGREIDLVLTDLNMPRMNGRVLLERLSRNNPQVRVILTSGNEDLLRDEKGQTLEVDFLPKPFTRQNLAQKVRSVLAK